MSNAVDNKKKRKLSEDGDLENKKCIEELEKRLVEMEKELMVTKDKLAKSEDDLLELKKKYNDSEESNEDNTMEEEDVSDPWNAKYKALREYVIINGHTKVPQSTPTLGIWVKNLKCSYNIIKQGMTKKLPTKLTDKHIILLDGIGFCWGQKYPCPTWQEQLEQLKKFKRATVSCNINIDKTSPSALAKWVSAQRSEFRRFEKGTDSLLSLDQIEELNCLDFNWKGPRLS